MIQVEYSKLSTSGNSKLKNMWGLSSYFPNICTILTRFLILDGTFQFTKDIKSSVLLVSLFVSTVLFMNQWIIFFIRLIYYIFEPLFYLYWASKTCPTDTILSLGLSVLLYCFQLQQSFKWFTDQNTRFNRKIIIIFVFTCKLYIGNIPFVGVNNFSVWLLLPGVQST